MNSLMIKPHPLLQPYVQAYTWSIIGNADEYYTLGLSPVGYGAINFFLGEVPFCKNFKNSNSYPGKFCFTGQLTRFLEFLASPVSVVFVLFKPYGAYKLLGIPQYLFVNDSVPIEDFLAKNSIEICSKLKDKQYEPLEAIGLLEHWLLNQLKGSDKTDVQRISNTCEEINKFSGTLPINELYRKVGMSKSSLEHYFKEQVGVSPKKFSSILRFNKVLNYLQQSAHIDWQFLVEKGNYFDQPHFIHEFKKFYGCTPAKYHLRQHNLTAHLSEKLYEGD